MTDATPEQMMERLAQDHDIKLRYDRYTADFVVICDNTVHHGEDFREALVKASGWDV